jgi:tyrosine-protein phosphatase YwqE
MAGVWNNTVVALRTTMSSFVRTLPAGDIPELHLGAEYMIDESLLQVADSGAELLTLPGGRVLVEMSYWGVSPQLGEIVTKLTDRGLVPVLAHPERYFYMADDLVAFDRLREAGCGFQLDMLAATGEGKGSPRIVNHLLARGMYTHVGSDIHTPRHLDTILDATIDEKTAEAGEIASLWWIK